MAKANNDAKIEFILTDLRNGMQRQDIMARFGNNWQDSQRTFDRLLKIATETLQVENKAKEALRGTNLSEALKSEIQAEILTEQELDLIMSRIVDGSIEVAEYIKGERIIRDTTPMEIIAAATQLYKRKGSYAPIKQANTRPDGTEIDEKPTLTDEQVDTILHAIKDSKAL